MKAAIIGAMVLLLSCSTTGSQPVRSGPAGAVEEYLAAVAAGEHQKAYELLSSDDRAAVNLSGFSKKVGSEYKVTGERNMSAEVAVEMVGPDPVAFRELMNELMDGRFSVEEIKQRTDQALQAKKFPIVKSTVHYLVVFEDGAWRVAAGYGARKKVADVANDPDAYSGSIQHLMWTNPSREPRVGPMEDVVAELTELRRQNGRLWEANHTLLDQALSAQADVAEDAPADVPAERREIYSSMINAKGPNKYQLQPAIADVDLSKVATEARIIPSFSNGKQNGFKLFSILPGSVYDELGFENGDVIKSINGIELVSPDEALRAYDSLKTAQLFDVKLARDGQPITLSYSVVEP